MNEHQDKDDQEHRLPIFRDSKLCKEKVDLVVAGTKDRSKLKEMLLGSTAAGVVMSALHGDGCKIISVHT
ncbi:MAG: hypothetical protein DA330_07085 [Nitrososphaera sp.]|nr:hypothetical protein [Nitrososphaera sp.]